MSIHKPKLIIALDGLTREKAEDTLQTLLKINTWKEDRILFKVNDLLDRIWLDGLSQLVQKYSIKLMLDMKEVDIPETMANSFSQIISAWLWEQTEYLTIMADAWFAGMKQVVERRKKELKKNPAIKAKILAVSVLTTMDDRDCLEKFWKSVQDKLLDDLKLIRKAGCDGMICSLNDAPLIREVLSLDGEDFILVTPWVRFWDGNSNLSQKRVSTPEKAVQYDCDIVMGTDILSNITVQNWENVKTPKSAEEIQIAIDRVFRLFDETEKWEISEKFQLEKALYKEDWKEVLKTIGAIYERPETPQWIYCRWTSGTIGQSYVNIGIVERNFRIVRKVCDSLARQILQQWIQADVVMGAQLWSIRLSLALAESLSIFESIYTEKWPERGMVLDRHDVSLQGKKVIISEDMISKASTVEKMKYLVESSWWTVVGITCTGNWYGKEEFQWIPLFYVYKPTPRPFYYDEETLETTRQNMIKQGKTEQEIIEWLENIRKEYFPIPAWAIISPKPKNEWGRLIQSMHFSDHV